MLKEHRPQLKKKRGRASLKIGIPTPQSEEIVASEEPANHFHTHRAENSHSPTLQEPSRLSIHRAQNPNINSCSTEESDNINEPRGPKPVGPKPLKSSRLPRAKGRKKKIQFVKTNLGRIDEEVKEEVQMEVVEEEEERGRRRTRD
ncbi:hypothetical protein M7I_4732 [Glarea lozoyensis 74030]|uniref:Uncharacterized protein n=1 Tax=Glarea lozoyensis (strain ATCC 74030 / MF5533) TaxID=1104152 RepID=H0EPZ1_GLAL7|nr:hypothetical protein M7I_4732 [Glarea lozoyensis 74030]